MTGMTGMRVEDTDATHEEAPKDPWQLASRSRITLHHVNSRSTEALPFMRLSSDVAKCGGSASGFQLPLGDASIFENGLDEDPRCSCGEAVFLCAGLSPFDGGL